MNVLMLGWEYPPYISGGLGTACEGLSRGLARLGVRLTFVVPSLSGEEDATHMTLLDTDSVSNQTVAATRTQARSKFLKTVRVPSYLKPYTAPQSWDDWLRESATALSANAPDLSGGGRRVHYGADMFEEVNRFAQRVLAIASHHRFDIIHAHDWMTFPAGVLVSQVSGKPLIVHVHSLEEDRSGSAINQQIHDIEHAGVAAAQTIIAVSYYTQSMIQRHHHVPYRKIKVVHNGVFPRSRFRASPIDPYHGKKVVLFLGRITYQKGPEYFLRAAIKVIPHVPDAFFVMAGSGDMLPYIQQRCRELGLEKHFHFPGFLSGENVESLFSRADLYVMPSVSEPFGITPLEAINCDTPVIISRQSGVAEVLSHALKVDSWDVDRMADQIINALLYEELREDMIQMAKAEVKRLQWDLSARKTLEIYRSVAG